MALQNRPRVLSRLAGQRNSNNPKSEGKNVAPGCEEALAWGPGESRSRQKDGARHASVATLKPSAAKEGPLPSPQTQKSAGLSDVAGSLTRCSLSRFGSPSVHDAETTISENTMADDKTKSGGQDRTRISLNEDYEVADWCAKFGVTTEQLKAAVAAVGDQASRVESYLKARR